MNRAKVIPSASSGRNLSWIC